VRDRGGKVWGDLREELAIYTCLWSVGEAATGDNG
jgi:hypothetical protein